MAIPKIKGTYSMDVETVEVLTRLARRWGVSKSEALRRAIHVAAAGTDEEPVGVLDVLHELQEAVALSASQARDWARQARAERRAASKRKEPTDT